MEPIISARDLVVRRGDAPLSFDVYEGLTLLIAERESGASTRNMALAGRFRPKGGEVLLDGEPTSPRQRFKRVALAGVELIDSLERQVDVREFIREQVAWSQMFFIPVRRDILNHPKVEPWLEPLGLTHLEPSLDVGKLNVEDRFRLRVMLALIARPDADLVIVDDLDQIRSLKLRNEVIEDLATLSRQVPVLATTVNDPEEGHADHIIDLRYGTGPIVDAEHDTGSALAAAAAEDPWSDNKDSQNNDEATDPDSPDTEEIEEVSR